MDVHALVLKSPEVHIVKLRTLDKLGQLDINFLKPVDLTPLPLQVRDPTRLEPISHVYQSRKIRFS